MTYYSFCCIYVWLDPGQYMIAQFKSFYKPGVTLSIHYEQVALLHPPNRLASYETEEFWPKHVPQV